EVAPELGEEPFSGLCYCWWYVKYIDDLQPHHPGGGEKCVGGLNEVAVPTLIIHGTDDPGLPHAHGLALKDAIQGSKLLTLEGMGHELHHEDRPVILQALKEQTLMAAA